MISVANRSLRISKKGLTLIELMITASTIVLICVAALMVYIAALKSWKSQYVRSGISINLDRAMRELTQDLRTAKEISCSVNPDEVRFSPDQTNYYIYYLYNAAESYPPNFTESSYALKKDTLSGGINGTFTYGSGRLVISDVDPPPTTDLSSSGNLVTIDLSVSRGDETLRVKTKIKGRNL